MADAQLRDPLATVIMAAPPLTQVALRVFEAGHPTGLHLVRQGRPHFIPHLGSPPEPSRMLPQRLVLSRCYRSPTSAAVAVRRYPSMGAAPRKLRQVRVLSKRNSLTRSANGRPRSRRSSVSQAVGL